MLYFFYHLYFGYEIGKDKDGKPVLNLFDLGCYSTKMKAEKQIQFFKNLPGFRDHPLDCFKIKKLGVRFEEKIIDKSKIDFFVLSHEYYDGNYDHPTIFPPFSSEQNAIEKMEKLKNKKPFCNYPDGFVIAKWCVDRNVEWHEGFYYADLKDKDNIL